MIFFDRTKKFSVGNYFVVYGSDLSDFDNDIIKKLKKEKTLMKL